MESLNAALYHSPLVSSGNFQPLGAASRVVDDVDGVRVTRSKLN